MQSQPFRCLHSHLVSGLHPYTDLTTLAMFRFTVSTIHGITVYSVSSGPSVSTTHTQEVP
jgi:hypothetical protein